LPLDWTPNPNCIAYAQTRGVDVNHEADQFRNHAAANGRKQLDWHASFRTWLGNAKPRPVYGNAPTRTEQNMAVVAKFAAIEGVQQKGLTP
jgi:thiamine biosynthesis protein ThiC